MQIRTLYFMSFSSTVTANFQHFQDGLSVFGPPSSLRGGPNEGGYLLRPYYDFSVVAGIIYVNM